MKRDQVNMPEESHKFNQNTFASLYFLLPAHTPPPTQVIKPYIYNMHPFMSFLTS